MRLELTPIPINLGIAILWLLLSTANGLTTQAAEPNTLEQQMSQAQSIVGYVAGWEDNTPHSDSWLRLEGGLNLRVARDNPAYDVWKRAVHLQQAEKEPVYVEVDSKHYVISLYIASPREVESVQEAGDKITVYFRRAPSAYTLNRRRPEAGQILALLKEGARTHTRLLVAVHPSTLEILAVELPRH